MSSESYTEKETTKMIRDAVKAALKDQRDAHNEEIQTQKELHDEAIQTLTRDHKAAHSPLSGTNLTKSSGKHYNKLGGIYTTPLATMARPSLATSSSTSSPSGGGTQTSGSNLLDFLLFLRNPASRDPRFAL